MLTAILIIPQWLISSRIFYRAISLITSGRNDQINQNWLFANLTIRNSIAALSFLALKNRCFLSLLSIHSCTLNVFYPFCFWNKMKKLNVEINLLHISREYSYFLFLEKCCRSSSTFLLESNLHNCWSFFRNTFCNT